MDTVAAEGPATAPEDTDADRVTNGPSTEPETGVALDGDYPLNHRLRAEALAAEGKSEDPGGLVSPELIADAGERMERAKAAEDDPLNGTVPEVEAHVLTLDDPAALTSLREREGTKPGKRRAGALAAIDARIAALATPPASGGVDLNNSQEG